MSLHQKIFFKKIGVLSPQTRFLPFGLLKIHLSTVKLRKKFRKFIKKQEVDKFNFPKLK
ncbi:hypothetical protein X929_07265 [Petrotoga olearia DSM 13574]|uniref:Uncharacterized protein n=1 Tax=Petrotoga olearia DSM 13574 TaxID=1122955 RepID=A0A2K1NYU2_9BACT|nr:hypothetical protein X929_07265 [Petrotoga olearia DSM 13574]